MDCNLVAPKEPFGINRFQATSCNEASLDLTAETTTSIPYLHRLPPWKTFSIYEEVVKMECLFGWIR